MGDAAIREAGAGDAHAVADLWTEAYVTLGVGGRADPYTEADVDATAAFGEIFVAEGEAGIVGVVALCESRARAAGWRAISLWSRAGQIEAHRLYESVGYRRVAGRDSVDSTGLARIVFRLDLG